MKMLLLMNLFAASVLLPAVALGGAAQIAKVEIPDPGRHKVPAEFREEILKAMKQGTPEAYRPLVKKYYEELVK